MTTTAYPDRFPVCPRCIARLDPITGVSPRCPDHQPHLVARRRRRAVVVVIRGDKEQQLDRMRRLGALTIHAVDARGHDALIPNPTKESK